MGGWILAELTMVLVLVVLGSEAVLPAGPEQSGPTPSPTTTLSEQPPSTPPAQSRPGINTVFKTCKVVMESTKDKAAARALRRCILEKGEGKRPGLVLVFGVTWDPSRPTAGEEVSRPMVGLLKTLFGPDKPVLRAFMRSYSDHRQLGQVIAEAYYFQDR